VVGLGLGAFGLLHDFVLQAGGGGHHAFALAVVFEEFLASLGVLGVQRSHALFGTLLQEGEGFHQLFILQALVLLADGVFDALGDSLGIEIIHAFLGQALAHVQANTVGGLLGRSLEFNA